MFALENLPSGLRHTALAAAFLMLAACGFRGPLYLPEDGPPATRETQPQLGEIPPDDPGQIDGEEEMVDDDDNL